MDEFKQPFESKHSPVRKAGSKSCCYKAIQETTPLVLNAIKLAPVRPGTVFTIVDYGSGDGENSMALFYACVQELRKLHGDDRPIHVIYEDQPVNDFKSLFLRLQGKVVNCNHKF